MRTQPILGLFTDKFCEVSNQKGGAFQHIIGVYQVGNIVFDEQRIVELLELGAPIDLYIKIDKSDLEDQSTDNDEPKKTEKVSHKKEDVKHESDQSRKGER